MSRRARLFAVFTLIVVGVGAWGALEVFAGSSTKAAPKVVFPAGTKISKLQPIGANAFQSTKLIHTYLIDDLADIGYTTGNFTQVGPTTTINCNPPNQFNGSCGLEAQVNIQALGTIDGQNAAVCTLVDGSFVDACPFIGSLFTTHYANSTGMAAINLPVGTHTVSEVFFSGQFDGADASIAYYSYSYRVYGTG